MKILIADNSQEVVELLRDFLAGEGHEVEIVFDGKSALELLQAKKYDLVFLDHDMPEMTGIEVLKAIKDGKIQVNTIMCSGYPTMQEFFIKTLGADEFIPKPFGLNQVTDVIKKYGKAA